ncbi:MAG: hypothetical protein Q9218_002290 [Villophora microphyllina]
MADHTKEDRLMTVYADVHYYFSAPTPRPLSHRFDKGSYLYLYRNLDNRGGRIEIANNVGKPEQDAFTGGMCDPIAIEKEANIMFNLALDTINVRQSYKHPTLCTVTIDGFEGHTSTTSPPPQHPEHHWRLPNTDPRNEGKYLFRLHTLDLYFWTDSDATLFMNSIEALLEPQQVEMLDQPAPKSTHQGLMSPVVQKLESVAVEDSAYHNGKTRNSKSAAPSFAPPPTASPEHKQETPKAEDPGSFKPLAYNPAAPPAPEPIKHREKTPPPPEAETEGTGLSAAAYNDRQHAVSPLSRPNQGSLAQPPYPTSSHSSALSSPQQHGNPYNAPPQFAGLTGMSPVPDGRLGSMSSLPPPPPQAARNSSISSTQVPSRSPSTQIQAPSSATSPQPTFSPPPRNPTVFQPGVNQPLASPSTQILGNSYVSPPPQPLQHLQPQYADYLASRPQQPTQGQAQQPIGGYSGYDYGQPHHHHHHHHDSNQYDVHSQVYRPTEEEAHHHKHHRPSDGGQPTGKFEQQTGRLDKGVNRFFKKLEKRIG